MAHISDRTTALEADTLFNNCCSSDIKLIQIYNGERKEYFAHRAILCNQSKYFKNALMGSFKEGSASEMELHDDDPKLFEIMLKFMYTGVYNKEEVIKLAGDDFAKKLLVPIQLTALADKYDVSRLLHPAADDFALEAKEKPKPAVNNMSFAKFRDQSIGPAMVSAVDAYYNTCFAVDSPMGRAIVQALCTDYHGCFDKKQLMTFIRQNPTFGADFGLFQADKSAFDYVAYMCDSCARTNMLLSSSGWCNSCGSKNRFSKMAM